MLPSFRLIVAGFLCGFVVVFAGLRLATSLNALHQALPITMAQAAAAQAGGPGTRGGGPVLYDMRFVASAAASGPLFASVTPQALERVMPPPLGDDSVAKVDAAATEPSAPLAALDPSPAPATEMAPVSPVLEPPAAATIEPSLPPEAVLSAPEAAPADMPAAAETAPASEPEAPKTAAVAPEAAPQDAGTSEAPQADAAASNPVEAATAASVAADPLAAAVSAALPTAAKPVLQRHRVFRRSTRTRTVSRDPFAGSASNRANASYNWK